MDQRDFQPHVGPDSAQRFGLRRLPPGFDGLSEIYLYELRHHSALADADRRHQSRRQGLHLRRRDLLQLPQERRRRLVCVLSPSLARPVHSAGHPRAGNELWRRDRSFLFIADTVPADYVDAGKFADLLKNLQ
jgi:hypothetical protein